MHLVRSRLDTVLFWKHSGFSAHHRDDPTSLIFNSSWIKNILAFSGGERGIIYERMDVSLTSLFRRNTRNVEIYFDCESAVHPFGGAYQRQPFRIFISNSTCTFLGRRLSLPSEGNFYASRAALDWTQLSNVKIHLLTPNFSLCDLRWR